MGTTRERDRPAAPGDPGSPRPGGKQPARNSVSRSPRAGAAPAAPGGTPDSRRRLVPLASLFVALAAAALAAAALPATGRGESVAPRSAEDIERTLALGPHAGDCDRCHDTHGDVLAFPFTLIGPDDNSLCAQCHDTPWRGGGLPDLAAYSLSSHGADGAMVWPGPDPPARAEVGAAGKCVNCHDPHGRTDALGAIPGLRLQREENLCLTCHDGSPVALNVSAQLQKVYRHPTTTISGRHDGARESNPNDFGTLLNRRHAECEDCHNPHLATAEAGAPDPARMPRSLVGVSRVVVSNGPAGLAPAYTFVAGADTVTGDPQEWQLCFKCHSSWTTQPSGQTDFGRALNPNNPSYHPVEDVGRDPAIRPDAFVAGWSAGSRVRCGDCHGDDYPGEHRGPHGSNDPALLSRPYTASSSFRVMSSVEQCFACHAYDVYASTASGELIQEASRFNRTATDEGHVFHVGEKQVPCYACHETHGSTSQPHLIATGRVPGLNGYTETPTGGSCTPTCHGPESYTINYPR